MGAAPPPTHLPHLPLLIEIIHLEDRRRNPETGPKPNHQDEQDDPYGHAGQCPCVFSSHCPFRFSHRDTSERRLAFSHLTSVCHELV
jgi:hypothetical protein